MSSHMFHPSSWLWSPPTPHRAPTQIQLEAFSVILIKINCMSKMCEGKLYCKALLLDMCSHVRKSDFTENWKFYRRQRIEKRRDSNLQ